MTTQLQQYQFNTHQFRVIPDENGEPWFVAKDVCNILGYRNSSKAIKDHCRKSGITNSYTPALSNTYNLIDEGNLYRLIIKSNKPQSEPFENWVCDEVLPSIRKTGLYQFPGTANKETNNKSLFSDSFMVTPDEFLVITHPMKDKALEKQRMQLVLTIEKEAAEGLRKQSTPTLETENAQLKAQLKAQLAQQAEMLELYRFKANALEQQAGAKKPKRKGTRPITQNEINAIHALHEQGLSNKEIAHQISRSTASVSYVLRGVKVGVA